MANSIDKDEFCEYIGQCEIAMYSVAFSILANESDAGEAVSEAIYRAYKKRKSLKEKSAFKAWILKIVHNTAVEMIRKNNRLVLVEETQPQDTTDNYDMTRYIALKDAVVNLKQPYRTVVVLFYYENLSISEISDITGSASSAVKKQLSRAREMLREQLREDSNDERL